MRHGRLRRNTQSSVDLIAEALNRSDFARAMIAAVLTRTPEIDREAARRLASAESRLAKYDPNEPRDWRGRWTRDGAARPAGIAAPEGAGAANERPGSRSSQSPTKGDADQRELLTPDAFMVSDDEAEHGEPKAPTSLQQTFERKYDDLGPVDFAKEVIQFGDRLGREGKNFSLDERERALAKYSFLQDRLSFWLGYDYKPPRAQENLISAAVTLYQGAINGGIVRVGELPRSMMDVAGAAWGFDNLPQSVRPQSIRPSTKPSVESPPAASVKTPKEIEGIGGVGSLSDNGEIRTVWGKGLMAQGLPWEDYLAQAIPGVKKRPSNSKVFDLYNEATGEAISAKTLNTLSVGYIKEPVNIYRKLKGYVDAAADYEPRTKFDLDPDEIRSKAIQLAIPEYTSPAQWRELRLARRYGRERGVSIVITRIRE